MTETLAGRVLTSAGWITGRLRFDAAIRAVEPARDVPQDQFVLPGFIDLHVHGGDGADVMDGADAVRKMARFHARHGTTALLATTVTAPADEIRRAFAGIGAGAGAPEAGAARVLGAHLEGPFISPNALGAQPPFAIPPDLALVDELAQLAPVARGDHGAGNRSGRRAARGTYAATAAACQIGHTTCSFAEARAALAAGAAGFTHLFNAMTGLHHRKPGAAGCALAHATSAEMIFDLLHVEEGAVLTALRAVPGLYGITDAVAAAGMPDGEYRLGPPPIFKTGDAVRLADGTIAGSALTMDRALRNLLGLGVPLAEAAARLSTLAADYLGLEDRGRIVPGAAADLLVVDLPAPSPGGLSRKDGRSRSILASSASASAAAITASPTLRLRVAMPVSMWRLGCTRLVISAQPNRLRQSIHNPVPVNPVWPMSPPSTLGRRTNWRVGSPNRRCAWPIRGCAGQQRSQGSVSPRSSAAAKSSTPSMVPNSPACPAPRRGQRRSRRGPRRTARDRASCSARWPRRRQDRAGS